MFKTNEIRPKKETILFLEDLKKVFLKHNVTMIHGENHIHFNRPEQVNFAQCCIANGGSVII